MISQKYNGRIIWRRFVLNQWRLQKTNLYYQIVVDDSEKKARGMKNTNNSKYNQYSEMLQKALIILYLLLLLHVPSGLSRPQLSDNTNSFEVSIVLIQISPK